MKTALIMGIALFVVGVFCVYWAQTHAPGHIGEQLLKKAGGSYSLSEPWYYGSMIFGVVLSIFGILKIYKEVK